MVNAKANRNNNYIMGPINERLIKISMGPNGLHDSRVTYILHTLSLD